MVHESLSVETVRACAWYDWFSQGPWASVRFKIPDKVSGRMWPVGQPATIRLAHSAQSFPLIPPPPPPPILSHPFLSLLVIPSRECECKANLLIKHLSFSLHSRHRAFIHFMKVRLEISNCYFSSIIFCPNIELGSNFAWYLMGEEISWLETFGKWRRFDYVG